MNDEPTIPPPTPDQQDLQYWLKIGREATATSFAPLEDAAKQLVVITSLLQGIYFAAISLSDVKKVGSITSIWFNIFVALSLFTVIFWMCSLYFATKVFVPQRYPARTDPNNANEYAHQVREAYDAISTMKYDSLTTAVQLLWYSFFPFAANLLIYLLFLPAPPPK